MKMDVSRFASGTYLLLVIDDKGNRETKRVIISHQLKILKCFGCKEAASALSQPLVFWQFVIVQSSFC